MTKVAFLGAGRMASAMVAGILEKKHFAATEIACLSAPDGTGQTLARQTGIHYALNLEALLGQSTSPGSDHPSIVVLAFKPQQLAEVGLEHTHLTAGRLILSILAGTPIRKLEKRFPRARNIVRAMPNTPGQIGAGITCFASKVPLDPKDEEAIKKILTSLGTVVPLSEKYLDAVTALSGSGPAYLFEFVAALRDGGIRAGLDPAVASQLARETTIGAALLLAQSGEKPETLRDQVSSPGGTTLAGLEVMRASGFHAILENTVLAAKRRSLELSRG